MDHYIANDTRMDESHHVKIITGQNGSGTVELLLKTYVLSMACRKIHLLEDDWNDTIHGPNRFFCSNRDRWITQSIIQIFMLLYFIPCSTNWSRSSIAYKDSEYGNCQCFSKFVYDRLQPGGM